MKKTLCIFIAALLLLALGGCCFDRLPCYKEHREIPDPGALYDYELYGQSEKDGLDFYYYRCLTDTPEDEYKTLIEQYSAHCAALGFPPDNRLSSSRALFIPFDSDALLLTLINESDVGYICAVAGEYELMCSAMDPLAA